MANAVQDGSGIVAGKDLTEPLLVGSQPRGELLPTPLIVRVEEGTQSPPSPLSPSWARLGNTHWLLTTAIMLSDMFGLGTLSLPAGEWTAAQSFKKKPFFLRTVLLVQPGSIRNMQHWRHNGSSDGVAGTAAVVAIVVL
jgi:hypothetical protein